jgi:hypothetical protein
LTHPFHPWFGREYEFVVRRRNWGEDRVCVRDEHGEVRSLPAAWTDVAEVDPFVVMAAGRCPFGIADLLELADLVERLRSGAARVGSVSSRLRRYVRLIMPIGDRNGWEQERTTTAQTGIGLAVLRRGGLPRHSCRRGLT